MEDEMKGVEGPQDSAEMTIIEEDKNDPPKEPEHESQINLESDAVKTEDKKIEEEEEEEEEDDVDNPSLAMFRTITQKEQKIVESARIERLTPQGQSALVQKLLETAAATSSEAAPSDPRLLSRRGRYMQQPPAAPQQPIAANGNGSGGTFQPVSWTPDSKNGATPQSKYKIPKRSPAEVHTSNNNNNGAIKSPSDSEWDDPVVKSAPVASYNNCNKIIKTEVKSAAAAPQVDEWGEPIVEVNKIKTPPPVKLPSAEVDEWGEPIVESNKAPPVAPVVQVEVDEWGEPVPKKSPIATPKPNDEWGKAPKPAWGGAPAKTAPIAKPVPVVVEEDEWGEPIKPAAAPTKPSNDWGAKPAAPKPAATDEWGSTNPTDDWATKSKIAPVEDDWGAPAAPAAKKSFDDDWGVGASASTTTSQYSSGGTDDWGSGGGGGRGRGRGRGRGGDRGGGRGGSRGGGRGADRDRSGDWPCSECSWRSNFHFRTTCFKCDAPKPDDGSGGASSGGGGSSQQSFRRGGSSGNSNYEPVAKRSKTDDWGDATDTASVSSHKSNNNDWGSPVQEKKPERVTERVLINPVAVAGGVRKSLDEWMCSDTRCGNSNFDWRTDCFRCGAEKGKAVMSRPSVVVRSPDKEKVSVIQRLDYSQAMDRNPAALPAKIKVKDTATETPNSWCICGEMASDTDRSVFHCKEGSLPLGTRFEAVAQNPGGGPGMSSNIVVSTVARPKTHERSVKPAKKRTVEAPKTRSKVRSTWPSFNITAVNGNIIKEENLEEVPEPETLVNDGD